MISDQPILARDANQKIFGEPMGPVQIRLTRASRDSADAFIYSLSINTSVITMSVTSSSSSFYLLVADIV